MFTNRQTERQVSASLLPLLGTLTGCLVGLYVALDLILSPDLDKFLALEPGLMPFTTAAMVGLGLLLFTYLGLSLGVLANKLVHPRSEN